MSRVQAVTILDPSDAFVRESIQGVPATYIKPNWDGRMPVPDNTFDLIICFGVLHHIPNVSFVVSEMTRTLKPGGYMSIREPIVSMGDWTKPRPGMTRRERGIPLAVLKNIIQSCKLDTTYFSLIDFQLTRHVFRPFVKEVFDSPFAVWFDEVMASLFSWNLRYHARNTLQKFRPASACFVLRKPVRAKAH